jgi:LysM repeat protein
MVRQKHISKFIALALIALLAVVSTPAAAQTALPDPEDLTELTNEIRAEQDLEPLEENEALMEAAQAHAEYLAENGLITHVGENRSRPVDRAVAAGYGEGAPVSVLENVASAQQATTLDYLFTEVWGEAPNLKTVYDAEVTDIGAGVAEAGGRVYYVLLTGVVTGPPPSETAEPGVSLTPEVGEDGVVPVVTVTPNESGAVVHEVQAGQALWSIALAYETTVEEIAALNGLDPENPVIFAGGELLIRAGFTPTASPTITNTPGPVTNTPRPTPTLRSTPTPGPTQPPTLTPTRTPRPLFPEGTSLQSMDRRTIGIGIIVVCAVGLLLLSIGSFRRKQ